MTLSQTSADASVAANSPREIVIVDASLAVKWVLKEDDTPLALRMLSVWDARDTRLIVPQLFYAECGNIVYKRVARKLMPLDDVMNALEQLYAIPFEVLQDHQLTQDAVRVAARYGLPSAYDGHYVALAELYQTPLWTADKRLVNSFQGNHALVKWLGDFPAA